MEARVEASGWTIKKMMRSLEYYKCLACQKSWKLPESAANQVKYT